ncbi:MAG TPA: P-loop NTPase fold protein [Longimicrobium sp.]|nr:P-loop NTPase fold protein [Longimicrobium sp.]
MRSWVDTCLVGGGSVFGDGPLWTAKNVARLNVDFVENLLTDNRSFLNKLEEQLTPSPPEVTRLAAEMLWLMMLFPSNVSYDAKLRLISEVHGWSGVSLNLESPFLRVLSMGVGSAGQAYNQHRWRELALLVRMTMAWSDPAHAGRGDLLENGWAFAAWLDQTPDAKNRQFRNILLHLLFPRLFERIASFSHKRLIVRHFAPKFGIRVPRESVSLPVETFDRPLINIRAQLEASAGRAIDFYEPEIQAQWRRSATAGPRSTPPDPGRAPPESDPTALEMRLEAGLREVVAINARLEEAIPELREKPTLSLLTSALIRSVEQDRHDTAFALWEQIRQALPPGANSVLLLFHLPYDQVPEFLYASPGDADVRALLGSIRGARVRAVLERADECAREVSGKAAPQISIRHLVAAILAPGALNEAKRVLAGRGHRLERLRAGLMKFFDTALPGDDLDAWRAYLDVPTPAPVLAEPGFARDYVDPDAEIVTADHLGVDPDVQALARVLCARSVEPPLSVGLFADWGTGKSTFMQRLKWNIGALSRKAEEAEKRGVPTTYQSGVVPIWFNAWHYMDANLWASLVTRIFERLAHHLSGNAGVDALEQVRKNLYGRLAASQGLLAEAKGREALAQAEADAAQDRVTAARAQETSLTRRIAHARDVAAGLWKAISAEAAPPAAATTPTAAAGESTTPPTTSGAAEPGDSEAAKAVDATLASLASDVKTSVGAAARELGIPEAQATVAEIRGSLAQMRGVWGNVTTSAAILHRQRRAWVNLLMAGMIVAATVAPLLFFDPTQVRAWISAAMGFFVSAGAVVAVLNVVAAKVRRVLERADAEIRAATERASAEADALQRELDRLKEAEAQAARDRVLAEQKVKEIAAEIEDIKAGRRLEKFIHDRAGSDEYRRHLGIIATIRRDFEALAALLEEVRRESAAAPTPAADGAETAAPTRTAPPVRRIVLYIDDLDRCPEDRVVEVLQAVHLLLAFPLFVVVVGVDSRWLLRAVHTQYHRLLASERDAAQAGIPGDDGAAWASTPQNYLEKIFQIPFTLEQMGTEGFGKLLGSLMKVRAPATPPLTGAVPAGGGEVPVSVPVSVSVGDDEGDGADPGSVALDELWLNDEDDWEEESGPLPEDEDDAGLNPPGLEVETWELTYLSGLAPLIGSPRMAKRFANVYRFIRAALSGSALDEFSGTAEQPGEFRAASLLLALLTGYPGEAVHLFRRLRADPTVAGETWPAFVRRVAKEEAGEQETVGEKAPTSGASLPARRWERMLGALEQVKGAVGVAEEMEPYRKWVARVARFSFQTGQILARHGA